MECYLFQNWFFYHWAFGGQQKSTPASAGKLSSKSCLCTCTDYLHFIWHANSERSARSLMIRATLWGSAVPDICIVCDLHPVPNMGWGCCEGLQTANVLWPPLQHSFTCVTTIVFGKTKNFYTFSNVQTLPLLNVFTVIYDKVSICREFQFELRHFVFGGLLHVFVLMCESCFATRAHKAGGRKMAHSSLNQYLQPVRVILLSNLPGEKGCRCVGLFQFRTQIVQVISIAIT